MSVYGEASKRAPPLPLIALPLTLSLAACGPAASDPSEKATLAAGVDTLQSAAWLDLSSEPIVLSFPDTDDRYGLMPMLDAWTYVFALPGKRTTGTTAGHFAITGPGGSGALPEGVQKRKPPTRMVSIIGRTQTNGPSDYAAVHGIQKQYALTPLSSFGKPWTPPTATPDRASPYPPYPPYPPATPRDTLGRSSRRGLALAA